MTKVSIRPSYLVLLCGILFAATSLAQDHDHGNHEAAATTKIKPPVVFLDKSPRIVEYQLKRLDNQRLLLVERKTDDKKYIPVFQAILSRVGMSPQFREEAVQALVSLQDSSPLAVLLETLDKFDPEDRQQQRTASQLSEMLLSLPATELQRQDEQLIEAVDSENSFVRSVAYAALIAADKIDAAWQRATASKDAMIDFLTAVPLVPAAAKRSALRPQIAQQIADTELLEVRRAAVQAIATVPKDQAATFDLVAPLVGDAQLRDAAVRTLLRIPRSSRGAEASGAVAKTLVELAENTPAKDRTTDPFIDAMQLADQLMGKLPTDLAKSYRARLNAITVRVVRIRTVEEEMRYDTPYFAVEAGRPVQVILENHDLMPHNLVVTTPGSLKEVALLGLQAGPNNGWKGLQYVPESEKVLFATQMVPPDKSARLTFDAPQTPGEYPYVCTFPQHWYRMYGVMVVVDDLQQWSKDPVEPANPIGSNRSFVANWKVDDLKAELDGGLRGRTAAIGKKIFVEASCQGCHKAEGEGGVIGPELTEVVTRLKGDRVALLREVLDPSHKVDAKYQMQIILTADGKTLSGIVVKEDDDNVEILTNPESQKPTIVPQDEIDEMVPSQNSMMPKALLDQYTKDEIFELLAYLESINPQK
jgi:putative heme-binding domain-containing protein